MKLIAEARMLSTTFFKKDKNAAEYIIIIAPLTLKFNESAYRIIHSNLFAENLPVYTCCLTCLIV